MSFPLVANRRVRESINALTSSDRLPHAVIIEGDTGTGKRTLARYLAQVSVCGEKDRPCGVCRNCHLAEIGTHPDIETVGPEEKKKNIAVDQIRALRTTAYHSAHTAKRRVFIIEQANTMNQQAQNSLLKVLEEPPSDVLFILITPSAKALLETVVSRCVVFSLFAPTLAEATDYLVATHKLERSQAEAVLKEEKNNIGKALLRLGAKSDSAGRAAAHDFLEAIERGSALSAMLYTVTIEKDRPEAIKFAEELSELLISRIKKAGNLSETAREYTKMYDVLSDLTPTLHTNINLSLFFTALASKLSAVKDK